MKNKLQKVNWEQDRPVEDADGQFYWTYEVDKHLEELHKKIAAWENTAEVDSGKLHWYSFTYQGKPINGYGISIGGSYAGYSGEGVTLDIIRRNKERAGLERDAILLSTSYLGFMTKEEFEEEFPDKE